MFAILSEEEGKGMCAACKHVPITNNVRYIERICECIWTMKGLVIGLVNCDFMEFYTKKLLD